MRHLIRRLPLLAVCALFLPTALQAQTTVLGAAADSFLRQASANQNRGQELVLKVRSGTNHRVVVQADEAEIVAAVGTGSLVSAHLEMWVESSSGWGSTGRTVDIHRLTTAWTEAGVTWNCPLDTNPTNNQADCATQWNGGAFEEDASDSLAQTNALAGWVRFDVTADVAEFLSGTPNQGWLLKRGDETLGGQVDYTSREGAADHRPRLVVVVESATFDETAPSLAITAPTHAVVVNDTTPAIELTYRDGGSGVDLSTLGVEVDGVAAACTPAASSASCEPAALGEGSHLITASLSDLAGNEATAHQTFELLIGPGLRSLTFNAVGDTDLRRNQANRNFGGETVLRVRHGGRNRSLVQFDAEEIAAAIAQGTLESAALELTISQNRRGWGRDGRSVDAHRLTIPWTELGATWSCPVDTSLGNQQPDCPAQWDGGAFAAAPTSSVLYTNDLTGTVSYDVTADVAAFGSGTANHGWIVRKTEENKSGSVDYAAREAGAVTAARLVVVLTLPGGGDDQQPPTIAASVSPPANAAGWHNTDVTVTFTCSDAGSGVASCPAPVTVTAEGAGQTVSGTATDNSGNSASATVVLNVDKTAPLVAITFPADGAPSVDNPQISVLGSVQDDLSGVLGIACNGAPGAVSPPIFSCALTLVAGPNAIAAAATDMAGNIGTAMTTLVFTEDETPPEIRFLSPVDGTFVLELRPGIHLAFDDPSGIDTATFVLNVNGLPSSTECEVDESGARCILLQDLFEGPVSLLASVLDLADNMGTASIEFTVDTEGLEISITSPETGLITTASTAAVTGAAANDVVEVAVNGQPASLTAGQFVAEVPLREGTNMIVAVGRKANGRTGTTSVEVTRDDIAPIVRIDSPVSGLVSADPLISVTGLVNDLVHGGTEASVLVNGIPARVAAGAFLVPELELEPGPNLVEAVATDAAGNIGRHAISVLFQALVGERLVVESGNGQVAGVNEVLSQPLVAKVVDETGNPIAGRIVTIAVTRNSGLLLPAGGGAPTRALQVVTDGSGRASAVLKLGETTGEGTNRVTAVGIGSAGQAEFFATGLVGQPDKILMTMGTNQRGAVGQPLSTPLEALVVDSQGNPVVGVPVTFSVVAGNGRLDGAGTLLRTTNSAGLARAVLTLGPAPGINGNQVIATFDDLSGLPASFLASGLVPGTPAQTRMSGVVLDNTHTPIPGSLVTVRGATFNQSTTTTDEGRFTLSPVPVGHVHLIIDPSTSPRPEIFPPLAFETVTVAGQDNDLGQPILIPSLNPVNSAEVGGPQDVTLQMAGVPGLTLTVFANSVTFANGAHVGTVSINQVHLDKVPMAPPSGTFFMPPAWTIQPAGTHFDPPARITIPNDGMTPGRMIDIYQFDHDLNQFVNVGKGTTSEDASIIVSDPGFGITAAGWGGCGQPPPPKTCTGSPPPCKKCDPATQTWVADTSQNNQPCKDAPSSFTVRGVNVQIDDSCRGVCMAGKCEDNPLGFKMSEVKAAATSAMNKIYGTCIGFPLRATMQTDLNSLGTKFSCISGSACGSSPGWVSGNNNINLMNPAVQNSACGSLPTTVLHELVHSANNYYPEDKPTGCEQACYSFGTGNKVDCH